MQSQRGDILLVAEGFWRGRIAALRQTVLLELAVGYYLAGLNFQPPEGLPYS